MKKLNLLLFLLPIYSFTQIQVYEAKKTSKIGEVGNHSYISKTDNTYSVCFQDIKFTQLTNIKCFDFQDLDNDFENLYNMIIKGFDEKKEQRINLDLPNELVDIKFVKNMGIVSLQFSMINKNTHIVSISPYYTRKQIDKLFGKTTK